MSALAIMQRPHSPVTPNALSGQACRPAGPTVRWLQTAQRYAEQSATMPFDSARTLYAIAAQTGLIQKSMLANRDFERVLTTMERLMLGPWARSL